MRLRRAFVVLIALGCLAAQGTSAQADYDPLGSGTTKLTLDQSFLALLKQSKVKLSALAPAKLQGGVASFPVSGGKFDPLAAAGTVEHEGALLFKAASGASIPLKALQLKTTQRHAPFSAKVGGSQLKLAQAQGLAVTRQGFGDKVKVNSLTLSAKLATRLAKKLRLKATFKAGQPLGSTLTKAEPETIAVLGKGKVSLTLDPGFKAKLDSLFVAVNPIFPAERPDPFTLAIFGGTIAPTASEGTIQTQGSIELVQIGGGQVFLREAWLELSAGSFSPELELAPSPPYPGKQGRVPVGALGLSGASVSADPAARTVAVANASVGIGANLASAFNEAFAKPLGEGDAFHEGESLGTITFTAQAR